MESEVSREVGKEIKKCRPAWRYVDPKPGTSYDALHLEMLESIRNTLEGILSVLKNSEIVYLRGKEEQK